MAIDWDTCHAAVWRPATKSLRPVPRIDPITLDTLIGIERQKTVLLANTERFLAGLPANNALLWGARGTGKSSLIKATLNACRPRGLRLIEVYKHELHNLPEIVDDIRDHRCRFIVYCDDLSFEDNENSYVALKTILEGSIEPPPENVLLYATSNRRHLLPEYMADNLDTRLVAGELHHSDSVEERISLSDRFGLWLSFYPPDMDDYLRIIDSYFADYSGDKEQLHAAARDFSRQRASHSGRTARQFYNYYSKADVNPGY